MTSGRGFCDVKNDRPNKRGLGRGCRRRGRWTPCTPPALSCSTWRVDGRRRRDRDRLFPWRRRQRHDVRTGPVPQWRRATVGRQCGRGNGRRAKRHLGERGVWGERRAASSRRRVDGGGTPHGLDVQRVEHREARGCRVGMWYRPLRHAAFGGRVSWVLGRNVHVLDLVYEGKHSSCG